MPLPLSGRVMVMEVSAFKSLSALVWACGNLGIVCLRGKTPDPIGAIIWLTEMLITPRLFKIETSFFFLYV